MLQYKNAKSNYISRGNIRLYQHLNGKITRLTETPLLDLIEKLWKFDECKFWETMSEMYPNPDFYDTPANGFYAVDHSQQRVSVVLGESWEECQDGLKAKGILMDRGTQKVSGFGINSR